MKKGVHHTVFFTVRQAPKANALKKCHSLILRLQAKIGTLE